LVTASALLHHFMTCGTDRLYRAFSWDRAGERKRQDGSEDAHERHVASIERDDSYTLGIHSIRPAPGVLGVLKEHAIRAFADAPLRLFQHAVV
jgi:hypothetical protein